MKFVPSVPHYIPLSEFSDGWIQKHAIDAGGANYLVEALLRAARQVGATPTPFVQKTRQERRLAGNWIDEAHPPQVLGGLVETMVRRVAPNGGSRLPKTHDDYWFTLPWSFLLSLVTDSVVAGRPPKSYISDTLGATLRRGATLLERFESPGGDVLLPAPTEDLDRLDSLCRRLQLDRNTLVAAILATGERT